MFKKSSFLPDAIVFAEMVSMVAPKDHDGPVRKLESVEGIQHPSDLRVHERNACVVSLQRLEAGEFVQAVMGNGTVVGEGGGGDIITFVGGGIW
mgnify:CR=1 FL=1